MQANFAFELAINSEAFRAQGIETSVEGGIGSKILLRGGYTYLDAVVQRSFTNSDAALLGPIPTWQDIPNGIEIGPYSPLEGARPFRRAPPHTGDFIVGHTYANKRITGISTAAFASRSDDSTYLEGDDTSFGNSLLLPNRNLDFGYAKLDLGGSFQWFTWLDVYAQAGESSRQPAHRAHRLSQPSLHGSHRIAPSLGSRQRSLSSVAADTDIRRNQRPFTC